jgi:hypothetical protein
LIRKLLLVFTFYKRKNRRKVGGFFFFARVDVLNTNTVIIGYTVFASTSSAVTVFASSAYISR